MLASDSPGCTRCDSWFSEVRFISARARTARFVSAAGAPSTCPNAREQTSGAEVAAVSDSRVLSSCARNAAARTACTGETTSCRENDTSPSTRCATLRAAGSTGEPRLPAAAPAFACPNTSLQAHDSIGGAHVAVVGDSSVLSSAEPVETPIAAHASVSAASCRRWLAALTRPRGSTPASASGCDARALVAESSAMTTGCVESATSPERGPGGASPTG